MSVNHCRVCAQCTQHPCTCISNFWILPESGENTLKGCECDPDNPIRLQDCFILHAIQHSNKARNDFCDLYPSLFPCEKERFDILFGDNPFISQLVVDITSNEDTFQRRMNNIPVYTSGNRGGLRLPVGHVSQVVNLPPHLAPKSQPKGCS
jgi:hypothetical protein